MDFLIGVEIDNSRIVWILNSKLKKSSKIRLTTVTDNQNKAIIRFYIKSSGKKYLICSNSITGIPAMPAGEPSIDIKASINGKSLNQQIFLNKKPHTRDSHNINRYTRPLKPILIIAAITALFAVAATIFLRLPTPTTSNSLSDQPSSTDVREQKEIEKDVTSDTKKETIQTTSTTKPTASTSTGNQIRTETTAENKTLPVEPIFIESEITDRHSVYFQPDSACLLYTSPSPRDVEESRMPSSA